MIANTARKSPNTLTICAIHRRRTGRSRNTSLKDRGVAGVAIRVKISFPTAEGGDVDSRGNNVRRLTQANRFGPDNRVFRSTKHGLYLSSYQHVRLTVKWFAILVLGRRLRLLPRTVFVAVRPSTI